MNILAAIPIKNNLEAVVEQFEHWRSTRQNKSRIPEQLWALLEPLKTQYSLKEIRTALKINHSQLKKRLQPSENIESHHFIQCASSTTGSFHFPSGASLSFLCKRGQPVTLTHLQAPELAVAMAALLGEPH